MTTTPRSPGALPGLPVFPPRRVHPPYRALDWRGRVIPSGRQPGTRRQIVLPFDWGELPQMLRFLAGKVVSVELDGYGRAIVRQGPHRVVCFPQEIGLVRGPWPRVWYVPDALVSATHDALRALRRA